MDSAAPPPRLDPTAGTQPGYAPISWTAVASLAVAGLFLLLLAALAVVAVTRKQPLIEPWLLAFPVLAVVLAFTARRQIANAEGTRTGAEYAAAGWWVGVLSGLGYVMYLFGVEVAIRNDAQREFLAFAEVVKQIDPANLKDVNLYDAVLRTVPPGQRGQVKGPKDGARIEQVFRDELARLRQLDLVRFAGRNKGAIDFTGFGVREWQQSPGKLSCTLSCKMVTPEGEHTLSIPMVAYVERGLRQWQVIPAANGFMQSQSLTRYGWMVEQLEASGQKYAALFLATAAQPEQQAAAYTGFAEPGRAVDDGTRLLATRDGRAVLMGAWSVIAPTPKGYKEGVEKLFRLADGTNPTSADLARFLDCWNNNRLQPAGFTLRDTPDQNAVLRPTDTGAELRFPIELRLSATDAAGAARGRLVLQATDAALPAELAKAREEKGVYREPPKELLSKLPEWRVVRIESDLKGLKPAPPPQPQGGGGMGF